MRSPTYLTWQGEQWLFHCERAMRYLDPSLEIGVIQGVTVRPLAGDYWIPGPVG